MFILWWCILFSGWFVIHQFHFVKCNPGFETAKFNAGGTEGFIRWYVKLLDLWVITVLVCLLLADMFGKQSFYTFFFAYDGSALIRVSCCAWYQLKKSSWNLEGAKGLVMSYAMQYHWKTSINLLLVILVFETLSVFLQFVSIGTCFFINTLFVY